MATILKAMRANWLYDKTRIFRRIRIAEPHMACGILMTHTFLYYGLATR